MGRSAIFLIATVCLRHELSLHKAKTRLSRPLQVLMMLSSLCLRIPNTIRALVGRCKSRRVELRPGIAPNLPAAHSEGPHQFLGDHVSDALVTSSDSLSY